MAGRRLADLTREEALSHARAGAVCVLPLGALEQHGAHLPLGTDTLVAETICARAAERAEADVLVAPGLWCGLSPHHVPLGATVTLRTTTLLDLLRDVVASLRRLCPSVLVVNGHGGNRGALAALGLEDGIRSVSYWELVPTLMAELFAVDHGSPGHAGQMETSLLLAAAPQQVRTPAVEFEPIDPRNTALMQVDLGTSGVLGDPHAADPDSGTRLLDALTAALARLIDESARPTPQGGTTP